MRGLDKGVSLMVKTDATVIFVLSIYLCRKFRRFKYEIR